MGSLTRGYVYWSITWGVIFESCIQWIVASRNGGFTIKNEQYGKFLNVDARGIHLHDADLIGVDDEFIWTVTPDKKTPNLFRFVSSPLYYKRSCCANHPEYSAFKKQECYYSVLPWSKLEVKTHLELECSIMRKNRKNRHGTSSKVSLVLIPITLHYVLHWLLVTRQSRNCVGFQYLWKDILEQKEMELSQRLLQDYLWWRS